MRPRSLLQRSAAEPAVTQAQTLIVVPGHGAPVFPIWLEPPLPCRGAFLEQTQRPCLARDREPDGGIVGAPGAERMTGCSVRPIAAMAEPMPACRFMCFGQGVANVRRAMPGSVGFGLIRAAMMGGAASLDVGRARRLPQKARAIG